MEGGTEFYHSSPDLHMHNVETTHTNANMHTHIHIYAHTHTHALSCAHMCTYTDAHKHK